jgi:hypothetical protein
MMQFMRRRLHPYKNEEVVAGSLNNLHHEQKRSRRKRSRSNTLVEPTLSVIAVLVVTFVGLYWRLGTSYMALSVSPNKNYFPRTFHYAHQVYDDQRQQHNVQISHDTHSQTTKVAGTRILDYPMASELFLDSLFNSRDYSYQRADPMETADCTQQYPWQSQAYPTCNQLHELPNLKWKYLANGFWRDVWTVPGTSSRNAARTHVVLKTMRFEHDLTLRNYDRNRRDAMAMERLSANSYVAGVYGYCSTSGLFEMSEGGDISHLVFGGNLTELEKLRVGTFENTGAKMQSFVLTLPFSYALNLLQLRRPLWDLPPCTTLTRKGKHPWPIRTFHPRNGLRLATSTNSMILIELGSY